MKLRNYVTYYNKIMDYCNAVNVQVKHEKGSTNLYSPICKTIKFDSSMPESKIISTLLHELGHHEDYEAEKYAYNFVYASARDKINENEEVKLTKKEYFAILENEASAWNNAVKIARLLKIPIGSWFYKDQEYSYCSYMELNTRFNKEKLTKEEMQKIELK